MSKAFVTGSRVYGRIADDADIDLVVFMDKNEADKIAKEFPEAVCKGAKEIKKIHDEDEYPPDSMTVFRFGDLNLLAVFDMKLYEGWKKARRLCLDMMVEERIGIPRADAVEIHKKEFNNRGFS